MQVPRHIAQFVRHREAEHRPRIMRVGRRRIARDGLEMQDIGDGGVVARVAF